MPTDCHRARRGPFRGLAGGLLLALAAVLVARPALAIHRQTPFLVALTSLPGGDSSHPSARGEPGHIAFESTSDLLHNGSTGRQIFLYNLDPRTQRGLPLQQITKYAGDSADPWVSSEAAFVVFDSAADIVGSGSSAKQIFLWKRQQNTFVQLTQGLADSVRPTIDAKGQTVAFQSLANLNGSGLPGWQIYIYDLTIGGKPPKCDLTGCHFGNDTPLFQVTNAPDGDSLNPVMSDDGRYVIFQSNGSLVAPSNGFFQIYIYDRVLHTIEQLTNGAGDSINPSTDQFGRAIAFQSRADLLNSGSTGSQVFLLDRERAELRQITSSTQGESFSPSIGGGAQTLSFLSTADLMGTGATGQHLFFFFPYLDRMIQVTSTAGSVTNNPVTTGNAFTFFDTDEDIMNRGITGRQIYSLNVYQRVPTTTIAKRTINLLPPQVLFPHGGSTIDVIAQNFTATGPIVPTRSFPAQLQFVGGDIDFRGEASVTVAPKGVLFPPVDVPGFGTVCIQATGNGDGEIDCDGGRPDGVVSVVQDHSTNDEDAGCGQFASCLEGGFCNTGATSGTQVPHPGPHPGVCNGPANHFHSGTFAPGVMQLHIPVTVSVSIDDGPDGVACSANNDDVYVVRKLATTLELTTGSASGAILDVDDTAGTNLSTTDTGGPFTCDRLLGGNFAGVQFVGSIPLLDVPGTPIGLHDVMLDMHLVAQEGSGFSPCDTAHNIHCKVLTLCTNDIDCDDRNLCNGTEVCVQHRCLPGTPLTCDDGNPCNGEETCSPTLGCQPGTPPSCDDGAICTADSCDPVQGCVHTATANCCSSDADCIDNNLCNGNEVCVAGTCQAGTNTPCDDGDDCNGTETCDPVFGCAPGTPPDRFSLQGAMCQVKALKGALEATPDQFLGGHTRVALLERLILKATRRIDLVIRGAQNGDVTARVLATRTANLTNALSQMRRFGGNINSGIRHHTVYPSSGQPLIDMSAEAAKRLSQVILEAPQHL